MANKTFETRIQLKYDSYANWTANNPTPLSGEVCIVVIPAETGAVVQEPSVLFKVGDGSTAFNDLPYVSAIAADVYDWAKAAAKPEYTADEIKGLADYISGEIQDTNTQYKLEQDASDAHILKLSKKDINDADYSVIATITTADTVYDDTALAGRVTALEGLVGNTAVATQISNAIAALDLANTYEAKGAAKAVQGETTATVKDVEDAVAAIKDGTTIDSFKDVETALDGKQPTGDYATKAEAQGYADAKDEAIAAAKKAGDDAMTEAQKRVASVAAGDNSVTVAGTATAPTVAAKLSEDADNALELAADGLKVVIPAAAEYTIEKAAESGEYAAIYNLKKDGVIVGASINIPKDMVVQSGEVVENPEGQAEGTYIKLVLQNVAEPLYINVGNLIEYVTSGSAAGDMVVIAVSDDHKVTATITDGSITLAKLATDIQTAIGKAHSHDNKTVLDGIDATKVEAWDAAEQNAKDYADGLAGNYDAKGSAAAAEQNAKDYADGLAGNYDVAGAAKAVQGDTTSTVKDAMDAVALKANDADLAAVAKSGKIEDIAQDRYIILNCGSSSTVI